MRCWSVRNSRMRVAGARALLRAVPIATTSLDSVCHSGVRRRGAADSVEGKCVMFDFIFEQGFDVEKIRELEKVYASFAVWCLERKDYEAAATNAKHASDLAYAARLKEPLDIKVLSVSGDF